MLADALEHLVRGLVPNPDDVRVARSRPAPGPHPRGAGPPRGHRQGHRTPGPHRWCPAHGDRSAGRPRAGPRRLRRRRPPRRAVATESHTHIRSAAVAAAAGRTGVLETWCHERTVIVGTIGRAHGLRGEVSVRPAHRRARASASPPAPSCRSGRTRAHRRELNAGSRDGSPSPSPRSPTARRPRRCAGWTCAADGVRRRRSGEDEYHDRATDRPRRRRPRRRPAGRGHRRACTYPSQDLLVRAHATPGSGWCRSSRHWCPRSTSPPDACVVDPIPGLLDDEVPRCGSTSSAIFPDYFAPLQPVAASARPSRPAWSTSASTTCGTGRTTGTAPSTTPPTAAAPAW